MGLQLPRQVTELLKQVGRRDKDMLAFHEGFEIEVLKGAGTVFPVDEQLTSGPDVVEKQEQIDG